MAAASSPFAVIVPALYACGVLTLYTAILATLMGSVGRRVPLYLSFAMVCLCAAVFDFATAAYYLARSEAAAVTALRWQVAAAMVFFPFLWLFVGLYTQAPARMVRGGFALAALVFGSLLAANAWLPLGIRFATIASAPPLVLPWGESLAMFNGVPTAWNAPVRVAIVGVFAFAGWRTWVQYRSGLRRPALMLGAYLVLQVGATIQGSLIDWGVLRSFYVAGFAFLAIALLMSVSMGLDLRDRTILLGDRTNALATEVERRHEAEARIRQLAYRDELTGLPNRNALQEKLGQWLSRARADGSFGTLLLVDLDHFRVVNDALGHDAGNQILREVAARLAIPGDDPVVLARLGGDEFVLLAEHLAAGAGDARQIAERIADAVTTRLQSPLSLGFSVGASIGITLFTDEASGLDVIRHAEMAAFQAKRSGRHAIHWYEPPMQAIADARMELESGLRGALEHGELALYFQPQVDAFGAFWGAEALLRWHRPDGTTVSPAQFLAVAEESGLIHPIGDWVLDRACAALAAWDTAAWPASARLAVNVSAWQLGRADYIDCLRASLLRHDASPQRLTLEVTESALLLDIDDTIAKLAGLRAIGVHVALDDFGTGYSSLAYLHRLPLDELKIDKSFVDGLAGGGTDQTLVETIIAVGHGLQLDVIAEGVESTHQHQALLDLGCDHFQGYLYGKPMPEGVFLDWIRRRTGVSEPLAT